MTEEKTWFKQWPAKVPKSLDYPTVPLHELLSKTAKEYPNQTAIAFVENELSYSELAALSDSFAAALAALGVKKGDCVAVFLPNVPQFIIAYYGALKAGAVLTAISPLHREREVEHQLADSQATVIVVLDSLYPIVEAVWQKTKLKNVIVTSLEEYASKTSAAPQERLWCLGLG